MVDAGRVDAVLFDMDGTLLNSWDALVGAYHDATEQVLGAPFPVEVLNVLGAGDAFLAGFLRGWVNDEPLVDCARYANACGALVVSRHGCAPAADGDSEDAASSAQRRVAGRTANRLLGLGPGASAKDCPARGHG